MTTRQNSKNTFSVLPSQIAPCSAKSVEDVRREFILRSLFAYFSVEVKYSIKSTKCSHTNTAFVFMFMIIRCKRSEVTLETWYMKEINKSLSSSGISMRLGAEGAHRAHNPGVRRSKLRVAKPFEWCHVIIVLKFPFPIFSTTSGFRN